MERLTEQDSWELLSSAEIARLAIPVFGDIEIFPISIAVDDRSVVFRSAEGTKLAASVVVGRVALEADHVDTDAGVAWSVVLKGDAELLERSDEIARAESLPLRRWHPQYMGHYVRVIPRDIQGRRLTLADSEEDE